MTEKYVVITGASRGLGKAFAEEFASKNKNLILVALENDGLADVAKSIKDRFNVKVELFETDLAKTESVYLLSEELNAKFEVDYLINNAGIGGTSIFCETAVEKIDNLIMINVRALSLLTRLLLPNLKRQEGKSFILNVASMASFSPMTYKAVYSASKAYVYYFSRALAEELKNTNVFVSVVHPGPMKTNAEVTRSIEKQGRMAKIYGLITPERTARIAIKHLENNVPFIVPGIVNWLNWIAMRLIPIQFQLFMGYRISGKEI
jgi:short-subunit dehydrogenase